MCDLSDDAQLGSPRLKDQAKHRRTEADARAPEFWVLDIETRHYSFEAYGLTADSCRDTMRRALYAHAKAHIRCQPGPNLDAWVDAEMADHEPQRRFMGEGYRDHECLTGGR